MIGALVPALLSRKLTLSARLGSRNEEDIMSLPRVIAARSGALGFALALALLGGGRWASARPQAPPPTEGPGGPPPYGLALSGAEAEEFLRTAEVVEREALPVGITRPQKLTLSDGKRTLHAAWKLINERRATQRMQDGGVVIDFRDSYKNELAAYELDKLLGLDMVPPTVERTIDGRTGALQLWVEGALSEKDLQRRQFAPRELMRWNWQLYKVRLVRQLTRDTDFRNVRNTLADPSLRVYMIDFSRAFYIQKELQAPKDLELFSRSLLEKLRQLDRPMLEARLGSWLAAPQVDALLARRDLIVALAEKRAAEKGEGAVFYP
jgi:hypothetical protein